MEDFHFEGCAGEDLYFRDLFSSIKKDHPDVVEKDHPDAGQKETQSSQDKAVEFQTPSET